MDLCCEADPTNLTGSNLNSQWLARRAKPMDGWSNVAAGAKLMLGRT